MQRLFFFLYTLLEFAPVSSAQFNLAETHAASTATWVSEAKTIAPGDTVTTALQLSHPDGWHSYYRNSGGMEFAPSIEWALPDGFEAGPIQWPVPGVKDGYFGKSFIYEGSPIFLINIRAPENLEAGKTVTLGAKVAWQICKESCINEERTLELTLTTATATETDPATAATFTTARAMQPANPEGWKITAQSDGGDILLRIQPARKPAADPVDFIPDQPFVRSLSSEGELKRDGDTWVLRLKRATRDAADSEIPQGTAVSGILLGNVPVLIPETTIAPLKAAPEPFSVRKFLAILGGMWLGGLILNLMPCVFPVIGLKIMGFVHQAGSERKKIVAHGLIFTLGVLVSFGVLSGILFYARATLGWGFQLQDPWVVFVLMLLMFVLALNMYGVFELGTSATSVGGSLQSKHGYTGTFFSGVLATVVATPCSGPFLGAAIGAAIALPAIQFFTAFAAMALGLALPYLILSIFPKLIEMLPRPGPWMESFKQAMSFLLFATAGYLLWVYAGLIELENLLGPVFGLSLIAAAAWIYGRWNLPHRKKATRLTAIALTLAFAATGWLIAKPPKPSKLEWQTWSVATEAALIKEGKPVYIDFTAQWCATCQLNKQRAYTGDVIDLMNRKGVVALKADKTRPNPEIEAALKKLGRTAIPVNVLIAPGQEPVVFPELLAPDELLEAFNKLPDPDKR